MDVTERKYQFGTEENQAFMKEIREDLLKFGHQFPSPGGRNSMERQKPRNMDHMPYDPCVQHWLHAGT